MDIIDGTGFWSITDGLGIAVQKVLMKGELFDKGKKVLP